MPEERPTRWWATTGFRITLLHLALTLLGTLLLAGIGFWASSRFAVQQIQAEIERDAGVLLNAGRLGGPTSIALSIEARIAADRSGTQYFLLSGPDGGRIAGNLAAAPRSPGWATMGLDAATDDSVLLALGTPLPAGHFLLVGRDLAPVRELEARLLGAAGWVGGAALLLALAGGLVIGRSVVRRAAQMERALAEVEQGRLATRLAARPGGDEFDRLARRVNATLDRLADTMAALRQVTDDIAHDLRTPLTRLRQRLESLEGKEAEAAVAECDRILEIFAALLRIAQIESGARRSAFAGVDLTAVMETVAELYASAAAERGQRLETDLAPGVAMQGDRELLAQMLANLVENAIRHGREGGRVQLALRPGPEITVTDDGPGIPDADKPLVFRRFHRLDAARSSQGAGLGLALVAAVAELHGLAVALEDASATSPPGLRVRLRG
ncbi:sensor histidine kinase [Falsiroseomonas tokyonensis]|uniref:histidine kinase n=1 Tax=Falsiroseomonas tokyonensis TaxID=430521 RepID=A0ABV7BQN7_9PROT|nr:HAMP domain-containing sensor histidine kinase [Falsiroseomonas tokyonensis]MBU8536374.1 HAMP domain-containing histidine kinase [Falsiroseomonas tokyonensis]